MAYAARPMTFFPVRASLPCLVLGLLACGGAQKPAESVDTSSLESSSSPAGDAKPASPASASTESPGTDATNAGSKAPSSDATAAPAALHPAPGATGSIDGKPFSPKLAQVASPMQKDGRITIII